MSDKIKKLYLWLEKNRLHKEADKVYGLFKASGIKPISVNRAEINYIADELLGEIREKLVDLEDVRLSSLGGLSFSPLMLQDVALDSRSKFFEETNISPIIDLSFSEEDVYKQVSETAKVVRTSETYQDMVDGLDRLAQTYFDDDPEKYEHVDSYFLEQQFLNTQTQDISEYLNSTVSMRKKNVAGDDIIINYVLTFTGNQGVKDASWSFDPSLSPPEHTIVIYFHPGSLGLQSAILNHRSNRNYSTISYTEEVDLFIDSIKPFVTKVLVHEQTHAEDIISPSEVDQGRKTWNNSGSRPLSLHQVAEESKVRGGALRLLVINYNKIFSHIYGKIPTYQEIYDRFFDDEQFSNLIYEPITNVGVDLVPSFEELYFYDKAFYALSREELKAHLNDAMTELIDAFEKDPNLNVDLMRPEDLINLSDTALAIFRLAEEKPVDKIVKTPIGYLSDIKKRRKKEFESGVWHLYSELKKMFGKNGFKKDAVLKRKKRKRDGKGERDRLEWALVSKKNPKKILKWFGTKRPTRRQVAKEEARVHAFAGLI